ncbi:hypothetical protein APA73_33950 [Pseudomonas aeruginosa]|jgi:hypothetical protein|uniref:DUF7740 domain-containing protein n=2 Tax=Ectopseudomonas TaxID=3236654 RepID=A0A3R8X3B1_ECTOL|nr:hypothetical protein [Pseudomonas sp.]OPE09414.1 hypothetical protein APA58_33300 [Pseudomonas aeruginosa]RAR30849.1 hypothetical protein DP092_22035 [Pseudomonas sp. MDMC224]RRW39262.1 hypothetical protein EGJ44_00375 [Pseudomonas oleovorans]TRO11903.1 hypothetical protein EQ829_16605 [Pseudomonas mendocina]TRO36106.1 hypothetical protein EQ832_16575 [Pseudomonas sp. ALS1131]WJH57004.1 hypothetical protein FE254_12810 [Pseudomonas guguanensis]
MTHKDAIFALMLSAQIHRTHRAIKNTARRCAKRLPKEKRTLMLTIAKSPRPLDMIAFIESPLSNVSMQGLNS